MKAFQWQYDLGAQQYVLRMWPDALKPAEYQDYHLSVDEAAEFAHGFFEVSMTANAAEKKIGHAMSEHNLTREAALREWYQHVAHAAAERRHSFTGFSLN